MSTDITMSLEIKDKDWKCIKDKNFIQAWKDMGYTAYGCLSDVRNYDDLPYFNDHSEEMELTPGTEDLLAYHGNRFYKSNVKDFLDWFDKQDKEIIKEGYVDKQFQQMVEQGEIPPTYCLWSDTEGSKQMKWKEPHPLTRLAESLRPYENKEARIIWIFW